ncbi:MAG: bifunctional hydroxymethylpyrimidine kinase/phosphomethylpyrimidine kinase [Planctomycetes bacterium]|nr:bifunctional hydroxymethylpyrimidine kinase/phosphomethylpyrimidine kinase [Planctomycetota bacterium]
MRKALSIAGSDSGGGAGIQADLKTFCAFRVYGLTAITAVTAQNTLGVSEIHAIPADILQAQIDAVLEDIGADAVKLGMLGTEENVRVVAGAIDRWAVGNVVLDPVFIAKDGSALATDAARARIRDDLLPRATVITPNIPEAEALLERPIRSEADMERAARDLRELGSACAVVKGGHAEGPEASDVLCDAEGIEWLRTPREATRNTHGTGCTFSSAIAASLAKARSIREAVRIAKLYVTEAIRWNLQLGKGRGPGNHLVNVESPW